MSPWDSVTSYLATFTVYYPAIQEWANKVRADIPSGRRSAFAVIREGSIVGLAITKNTENAKLCHISVSEVAREDGIGAELMRAVLGEVLSNGARRLHVTTGEEVTDTYREFFRRMGFQWHAVWKNRYRSGFDEIEWATSREMMVCVGESLCESGVADHVERINSPLPLVRLSWDFHSEHLFWESVYALSR